MKENLEIFKLNRRDLRDLQTHNKIPINASRKSKNIEIWLQNHQNQTPIHLYATKTISAVASLDF